MANTLSFGSIHQSWRVDNNFYTDGCSVRVQSLNGTREQVEKIKALKAAKGDGEADMMQVDEGVCDMMQVEPGVETALGADDAMGVDKASQLAKGL